MNSVQDELQLVKQLLAEANATLDAIRRGSVDAIVVDDGSGDEVYALDSREVSYREFIEQMNEGAASIDQDGSVLFSNQFLCDLVETAGQPLHGSSFQSLVDSNDRASFAALLSHGEDFKLSTHLIARSGKRISVRLLVAASRSKSRRRFNVVVSDRRDLDKLELISAAREEAEAASSAKDRFLAVLGHELRNPLAALTSSVALLETDMAGELFLRVRTSMERQLHQLQSIIDDLLDLNRVAHGKIVLKTSPVAVDAVVAQAVESVAKEVQIRGHELIVEPIDPELTARADATRLEQIVANLLTNAVRYTPPHGRIRARAVREGEMVAISVVDNGIGLEPHQIEQIYEPFMQLGDAGQGGLGIGLTLVRQLVDLHRGSIQATSGGRDKGTCVEVRIPIAQRDAVTREGSARAMLRKGLRVLVVDDNEDAASLLALLLRARGVHVGSVNLGADVFEAVERQKPELILLDLGLPDISGYDVAKRLRARGDRMVIVALTGFSHPEARARVIEAGFDDHIVKPLTLDGLSALTEKFAARL